MKERAGNRTRLEHQPAKWLSVYDLTGSGVYCVLFSWVASIDEDLVLVGVIHGAYVLAVPRREIQSPTVENFVRDQPIGNNNINSHNRSLGGFVFAIWVGIAEIQFAA